MSKIQSPPKIVIIGGISGSGCSTMLRALEDFHFATVGKLPIDLIESYIVEKRRQDPLSLIAIVPEIKSEDSLSALLTVINNQGRHSFEIVFLEASDPTILKRYSETRRPHPDFAAPEDKTLIDAISRERNYLMPLKEIADLVIDTTELTVHDLKREISKFVEEHYSIEAKITINFVSFGYKFGVPLDCDLVIDVRFLPNPYFIDEFKSLSGLDKPVAAWVKKQQDAQEFIKKYSELLRFLIPKYAFEGKAYLNIGVGCTGGRHRSVAIAEELMQLLEPPNAKVTRYHRDIDK